MGFNSGFKGLNYPEINGTMRALRFSERRFKRLLVPEI